MRLLLCLAESAGKVVSIDELLREVWSGVIVTPDSVYQAVASLRRLLGDDHQDPLHALNTQAVDRLHHRGSIKREQAGDDDEVPRLMRGALNPEQGRSGTVERRVEADHAQQDAGRETEEVVQSVTEPEREQSTAQRRAEGRER